MTATAIGLSCLLAYGRASAATCPPSATVTGAARIVEPVRSILRDHDVSTDARKCGEVAKRVQAWLIGEPGARGYVLRIKDPFGRRSERRVGDAETAASLIESWLAPETESVSEPAARRAAAPAQVADEIETRAAPPHASAADWRVTGAAEIGTSGGDSLWYGGTLTACGSVGALCAGGRLRLARDDNFFDLDHDSGSRSAIELLALAAWPLLAHGVTLTPLLGFGVGRLHGNNPILADGEADMPGGDDIGLRMEAAASAGFSLNRHLTLVGELSASHAWSMVSRTSTEALLGERMTAPTNYLRAARSRCNTRHEQQRKRAPFPAPGSARPVRRVAGARLRQRRLRALEELFHRHGPQVNRILGRLGHVDRRDLEDLVQVTFIEVHRSARRFGGRSAVGTWILSVALNVARHHARSESRRRTAMAAAASSSLPGRRTAPTIA